MIIKNLKYDKIIPLTTKIFFPATMMHYNKKYSIKSSDPVKNTLDLHKNHLYISITNEMYDRNEKISKNLSGPL